MLDKTSGDQVKIVKNFLAKLYLLTRYYLFVSMFISTSTEFLNKK